MIKLQLRDAIRSFPIPSPMEVQLRAFKLSRVQFHLVTGRHEHRAEDTAVGKNSPAVFTGEFANDLFAIFVAKGRPDALQLVGTHKTMLLGCKRRFDLLGKRLHLIAQILRDRQKPSIGIDPDRRRQLSRCHESVRRRN